MANPEPKLHQEPQGPRHRLVAELHERLRSAEAVLRALHEAKTEADQQAKEFKRADAMKAVTGSSAIEQAIAATSRMIDRLKREVNEVRRTVTSLDSVRLDAGVTSLVG